MGGLFKGGSVDFRDLDDLENEFYEHVDPIKSGIFTRLLALGFYHHRPDRVIAAYAGGGVALGVFMAMGLGSSATPFRYRWSPASSRRY